MEIFKIAQEFLDLLNEIEELEGELTPELEERLKINAENMSSKMEGYCKLIRWYDTQILAAKEETERLRKLIKRAERSQEWMKGAMLDVMEGLDKPKVSAGTFTVGTRKSTAVNIIDESAIPARYANEVVTVKIDKTAIKDAIKNGEEVPGAQLVERKSLTIK